MKLLFIDDLNANQLTKKELHNIVAKGDTRIDGGPDTDGEENCFPPPPPGAIRDKKIKYCLK
jgi:hypothetical protein